MNGPSISDYYWDIRYKNNVTPSLAVIFATAGINLNELHIV
jgi:hypothetical protein